MIVNGDWLKSLPYRREGNYILYNYCCAGNCPTSYINMVEEARREMLGEVKRLSPNTFISLGRYSMYIMELCEYLEDNGYNITDNLFTMSYDFPELYIYAGGISVVFSIRTYAQLDSSFDDPERRRKIYADFVSRIRRKGN